MIGCRPDSRRLAVRALILPALFVPVFGLAPLPVVPPPPERQPAAEKFDPARDLQLVAELKWGETLRPGTDPWVELTLVNTSQTITYPVVRPGDGSEVGWRDPHVFFTAELLGPDDRWTPVPKADSFICGSFAWDWPKDVIDLKPGEKLEVNRSGPHLEFQKPGKVHLVGHYAYRATSGKRGEPRPEDQRGRMKGVPLFHVVSNPVEF